MSLNSKNILAANQAVQQPQPTAAPAPSVKKQETRKLQAHDKIPQGLQSLMNKQPHQMFSGGTQLMKSEEKRRAETRGEHRNHYTSNTRLNQLNAGASSKLNHTNHKFTINKTRLFICSQYTLYNRCKFCRIFR